MDDDDDLFAVRPRPARRSAKAPIVAEPARIIPEAIPAELIRQPSGRVASFSCVCGGQDEVREPAPATVQCWACARVMKRWACAIDTPYISARDATPEERARATSTDH